MTGALITVAVASSALSAVAGARSEKATLSLRDDASQVLHCQFNPTEYTITKSARWARVPVRGAASSAPPEFVGSNAGSMQVELFFDAREAGNDSVVESVNRLLSWTQPSPDSIRQGRPSPPVVVFEWGGSAVFHAYVSSAAARLVLFTREGVPIRAHVSLQLEEVPRPRQGTNPTSTGIAQVRRQHAVDGDSLPLLAHREYGRADLWRAIAAASGIEDPTRVRPGTPLMVPERPTPVSRRHP